MNMECKVFDAVGAVGGYLCARCVASRMDRSHPSSYSARQTLFQGNFSTHFVQQYVTLSIKNDFLRCYLCYLDIPDSESVSFFLCKFMQRAHKTVCVFCASTCYQ